MLTFVIWGNGMSCHAFGFCSFLGLNLLKNVNLNLIMKNHVITWFLSFLNFKIYLVYSPFVRLKSIIYMVAVIEKFYAEL